MKRIFILTGALVLVVVVLQACHTRSATEVQAEEKSAVLSNDQTNSEVTSNNSLSEHEQQTTAYTVVYQDHTRTVYQMNQIQLAALSGYEVEEASIQTIVQNLQQEATWLNQQFSSEDASLIASAALNEWRTIQHTLTKILQNNATDLRLVVYHSPYHQTAHFGTNNNDQNNQSTSHDNHADSDDSLSSSSNNQTDQNQQASTITVAYQDNVRTVYQMNQHQLSILTGSKMDNSSLQTIIQLLQQEDTWLAQQFSDADVTLIVHAANKEANSIQHTLEKMLHNQATELRLVISHSQYRSTAHFGTKN